MNANHILNKTQILYNQLITNAIDMEDILDNSVPNKNFIQWTTMQKKYFKYFKCSRLFDKIDFLWYRYIKK